MAESPDELAVRYEGLAARVARRNLHRVHPAAAGFDDLKAVAWAAVWEAAKTFDESRGIPWELYAELVARRAVNAFVRVERRRGLTWIGDKTAAKPEDFRGPTTFGFGDLAWRVPDEDAPAAAAVKELLDRLAGLTWKDPRAVEAAELVVRHGLTQSEVARRMGVTRQRVGQILAPLRRFLRDGG